MKASFSAVCATAAVVLVSAAIQRHPTPSLQADSLARFDAITSFCEKADPTSQDHYASHLAALVAGQNGEEISRDRGSEKYRKAMLSANETLSRTPAGNAVRACGEFLAQN